MLETKLHIGLILFYLKSPRLHCKEGERSLELHFKINESENEQQRRNLPCEWESVFIWWVSIEGVCMCHGCVEITFRHLWAGGIVNLQALFA